MSPSFRTTSSHPNDPTSSKGDRARWVALWRRAVPGAFNSAERVFTELARFYGEPHRRYHTWRHIERCLEAFDQISPLADHPDAVEMALWFHDAIYTAGAKDNEWRSAELFREWSKGCADSSFRDRVHRLIIITTHREIPNNVDERLLVDIDLSSFGLPWDEFIEDGQQIRAEFAQLSDEVYFSALLRFLLSLLNRPAFFFSDYFQQRHEQTARANVRRLIENLRDRGHDSV